jgi:tetratricopeptide (TPR) repeat protein
MGTDGAANRRRIFVSYSHRDQDAKAFVQRHLGILQQLGDIRSWDDSRIGMGDDWFEEIAAHLEGCDVAVLLISTDFLGSDFCMKQEVPVLLERRSREGMMIAPILLRHCAWQIVPWLAAIQMRPGDGAPLQTLDEHAQEKELSEVVIEIHGFLQERQVLIAEAVVQAKASRRSSITVQGNQNITIQLEGDHNVIQVGMAAKAGIIWPALDPARIDLTRLPVSGYDVVGRDAELRMLDEVFAGEKLNVVALRAWGGVGKSTLVNKWCDYLKADNFRGASRVFAWSFYSQGTNQRVTSADQFIDEALRFFGDDDPSAGSPWAKGERLAGLVGKEKALLILDGMEPLQDKFQGIKDPALARLVECLAAESAGLCVITTRGSVKELEDFSETTSEIDLEQLSKEAGRALLRIKGLCADGEILEAASIAFGNHALAIDLLGSYLKRFEGGNVKKAFTIPDLSKVSEDDGKHPRRVMAAFAEHFGEGPELELLRLIGLFDRPADGGCIQALRAQPAIRELTDMLSTLEPLIWRDLLEELREIGLLAESNQYDPEELDAHPLVRQHFGVDLHGKRLHACYEAHFRLYEHLITRSKKYHPDTLAEMELLFQAIYHGCQAERHQEAMDEIYINRLRRREDYVSRQLGAYSADLGALAAFFDTAFTRPAAVFPKPRQAFLLHEAAYRLGALGRLAEAKMPLQSALGLAVEQKQWGFAAVAAANLSELQLAQGEIEAGITAEAAVAYADHTRDHFTRMANRAYLADVLHHFGDLDASKSLFEEAEAVQTFRQPQYPLLYSQQGNRYCDLLLTLNKAAEVRERATQTLEWATHSGLSLLTVALDYLSLGRTALALDDKSGARTHLDQAVDGLRNAGKLQELSLGLLARAALFRETGEDVKSRTDLSEVIRLAKRCGMRLHECDAHLEYARLALAEKKPETAREHLAKAKQLVQDCGYHRRDGEVAELEAALA